MSDEWPMHIIPPLTVYGNINSGWKRNFLFFLSVYRKQAVEPRRMQCGTVYWSMISRAKVPLLAQ